jgi:hypothetical protein
MTAREPDDDVPGDESAPTCDAPRPGSDHRMRANPAQPRPRPSRHGRSPSRSRSVLAVVGALSLAVVVLAACGGEQATTDRSASSQGTTPEDPTAAVLPAAVQALDIEGSEYAFTVQTVGGDALAPGWTKVTFHNRGAEAHQVMFASLKDGVDLAQLAEAAGGDSSGSKAIEYVDMLGGVSYVGPGRTVEAMVDLPEGVVMAMCYVPDAHGVAHALSGMTTVLTVGGATDPKPDRDPGSSVVGTSEVAGTNGLGAPVVQGTIVMDADGYHLPSPMPAGWYHVVNHDGGDAGIGLHELSILGLDQELDQRGLARLLGDLATNAPPSVSLAALGGMGALSGGFAGYLYLDLEPGHYLAVDFMPDPGDPRPHLLDGYATEFQP